ncbi:MAG: AraC family transcriptional regulator ligand-binding domain-containing protein [Kofleriaceae bacterium]|nr:AraC family transcriptional regulator ligand-binding domain-containing protein [Kofleriaceae bacterium]
MPNTILAALPAALFAHALHGGITASQLASWGLPEHGFPDPDAFVPFGQCLALWDALAQHFPQHAVGVDFGAFLGEINLGVVGFSCANAATLGQAIDLFIRLQHVVDPGLEVGMKFDNEVVTIEFQADKRLTDRRHPMEAMLVSSHRLSERLVGTSISVHRVIFGQPPCAPLEHYLPVFGLPPCTGQKYSLSYRKHDLERPVIGASPDLERYLRLQAEQIGKQRVLGACPLTIEVIEWIETQVDTIDACFEATKHGGMAERVSTSLGKSLRSLQRQLKEEGTSFQELLDEVLMHKAKDLLRTTCLAGFEIAFALGYKEPRAFQRAFKRWTGLTPHSYRKSHE